MYVAIFIAYTYHRIVTILPIGGILDDLRSAVGQLNAIFTARYIAIADRIVIVIVGRLCIVDGILKVERHAGFVDMLVQTERQRCERCGRLIKVYMQQS